MNLPFWRTSGIVLIAAALGMSSPGRARNRATQHAEPGDRSAGKQTKKEKAKEEAADLPAVLSRPADDPAALDLYYGEGGKDLAPDPNGTYKFIGEDLNQTQPKIDVKDGQGHRWRIKLGPEAKPETAATRLIWAAGYFVDENYYLDHVAIQDLGPLKRGKRYMSGNVAHGARLKFDPEKQKNLGYWDWTSNPFAGTREMNGLRVMMALLNNWDLVSRNNKIYEINGDRRYVVSDLGATFGRSGNEFTRKTGDLKAYAHSQFIAKVTPDTVNFAIHARPLPMMALGLGRFKGMPHYYSDLVHGERVVRKIPRADARWMGQRLAKLSEAQIRDCFRSAGYSAKDGDGYVAEVRKRIAALAAL